MAPTTTVVAAPAQAMYASPLLPQHLKILCGNVWKLWQKPFDSAVDLLSSPKKEFDGGNTSSSSYDASLQDDILPATIPPVTIPPVTIPPATILPAPILQPLPAPPMTALPMTEPPMVALASARAFYDGSAYATTLDCTSPLLPTKVICRFCFDNIHEAKNRKCWDCLKTSDRNKAIAARDEEKMKNPTGLHFIKI